jgi:hypothetical protein
MKDKGIKKIIACSYIEGHKMVHPFLYKRYITSTNMGDLCKIREIGLANSRILLNVVE